MRVALRWAMLLRPACYFLLNVVLYEIVEHENVSEKFNLLFSFECCAPAIFISFRISEIGCLLFSFECCLLTNLSTLAGLWTGELLLFSFECCLSRQSRHLSPRRQYTCHLLFSFECCSATVSRPLAQHTLSALAIFFWMLYKMSFFSDDCFSLFLSLAIFFWMLWAAAKIWRALKYAGALAIFFWMLSLLECPFCKKTLLYDLLFSFECCTSKKVLLFLVKPGIPACYFLLNVVY